jgi:hypothetical protein
VDSQAAKMDHSLDKSDSKVFLRLDMDERLVKHPGENEQAKGRIHDAEIDREYYFGCLQLVVGQCKTHLQM